uniref:Putative secreted protein n=1 Tax=Ixodes ricinus TaxID=34613 RepID=A0A6B0TWE9_IXORI
MIFYTKLFVFFSALAQKWFLYGANVTVASKHEPFRRLPSALLNSLACPPIGVKENRGEVCPSNIYSLLTFIAVSRY